MTDSSTTVVAVNGPNGNDVARARQPDIGTLRAFVVFGERRNKNGEHGEHATGAIGGGPGGSLTVELSESTEHYGNIHVATKRWEGAVQPVLAAEVSSWRTILLSAKGGDGANGNNGGAGQDGLNGDDGVAATAETAAQDGAEGGIGGNAGRGSDGGDGGAGGLIQILLGANETHLLLAVKWDVTGGKGGTAGHHGKIGKGGNGGKPGDGIQWKQFVGYKYYCTTNCLGRMDRQSSTSTALTKAGSSLGRTGAIIRSAIGSELVQGDSLQAAVALIATRYNTRPQRTVDIGVCSCAGGARNANCVGCGSQPIHKTLHRNPGQPGKKGLDGQVQTTQLNEGLLGATGQVAIVVQDLDGTTKQYSEPWKLRLRSFDVEDENQDGIFEPGEKVFIRRICIENIGGMPSPLQGIELSMRPSQHFTPDPDTKLFIPPSIASGSTVTLDGFLCARIDPLEVTATGKPYLQEGVKLSIFATVRWLNRTLEDFEVEKTIDIQSPCALSNVRVSSSVSPGSIGSVTWDVINRGNGEIGEDAADSRQIEVVLSIPSEYGTFQSEHTTRTDDFDEVSTAPTYIKPRATSTESQVIEILRGVQAPARFEMTLALYIADPSDQDESWAPELVLAQMTRVTVHISENYRHSTSAEVLMVVNSATPPDRVKAMQAFIREELALDVDCWDLNLHGGLQMNERGKKVHLFDKYRGKTMLLLGESFSGDKKNSKVITDLCDSRQMRQSLSFDTSFLALGLQASLTSKDLLRQTTFNIPDLHAQALKKVPRSARFPSAAALANAILGLKKNGNAVPEIFLLTGERRHKNDSLNKSIKRQASAVARELRRLLPQARFLVSPIPRPADSGSGFDEMIVLLGPDRSAQLQMTEKTISEDSTINAFEKYSIISSLSAIQRAKKLWASSRGSDDFVTEAAICSLSIDCVTEINSLAYSDFRLGLLAETPLHLPTVVAVLSPPQSLSIATPRAVTEVLLYCLAACRPQDTSQKLAKTLTINNTSRQRLFGFFRKTIASNLKAVDVDALGKRAKQLHGETLDHIVERTAKLTEISSHAFRQSIETSLDVVPESEVCTAADWDAQFLRNQAVWRSIEEEEGRASKEKAVVAAPMQR